MKTNNTLENKNIERQETATPRLMLRLLALALLVVGGWSGAVGQTPPTSQPPTSKPPTNSKLLTLNYLPPDFLEKNAIKIFEIPCIYREKLLTFARILKALLCDAAVFSY